MVLSVDSVFGLTLTLWTFAVCLNSFAEGQARVIGSLQPIKAAPGDDVILPCHLEPWWNVQGLTVEWSKPDLKPDPSDRLSRVPYVHLYRDRREDPDMKLESYVKRTALFMDGLKRGNISLRIMNVTVEDQGRYKCFIPKLKSDVKDSIVLLLVDPSFVKTQTTETPRIVQTPDPKNETNVEGGRSHVATVIPAVFLVLLIILSGVCGFLLRNKCEKHKLLKFDSPSSKPPPA